MPSLIKIQGRLYKSEAIFKTLTKKYPTYMHMYVKTVSQSLSKHSSGETKIHPDLSCELCIHKKKNTEDLKNEKIIS